MTDLALASRPPVQRVRHEDLGEPPAETYEIMQAHSRLSRRQLDAYLNLVYALWTGGRLPIGLKALAAKAKVGPATFEKMVPDLMPWFDHGLDGRWRNLDLEDARARRLGREPGEDLPESGDPSIESFDHLPLGSRRVPKPLSATRSAAAHSRWDKHRARLSIVKSNDAPDHAKVDANACKSSMQNQADLHLICSSVDARFASPSYGSIDRSSSEVCLEEDDRSIRAGERDANADANPACKTGELADAKPPCKADELKPSSADHLSPPSRSLGEVDDAALISSLRAADTKSKIPAVLLNPSDLAPLRLMVAEGCELERDVVPAVFSFANGLKAQLRTFSAKQIREKAIASRSAAVLQTQARHQPAAELDPFVIEGSPPWRAWLRCKGVKSHFAMTNTEDRTQRGYRFPTIWPPDWDEARLSAAEESRSGAQVPVGGERQSSTGKGIGGTDSPPPPGG